MSYFSFDFRSSRLKMVKTFKEEFEQMDINLIRYNVRGDSDDFLAKLQVFYEKEPAHTIVKLRDYCKANLRNNSC